MARTPHRQKKVKFWLWLVGGLLVALVAYFSRSQEAPLPRLIAKVAPPKAGSGAKMSSEGETLAPEGSVAAAGAGGASGGGSGGGGIERRREFFLCGQSEKGIYFLPKAYLRGLFAGDQKTTILIDEESRCLATGKSFDLAFVDYDANRKVPWRVALTQKGSVAKVEDFPSVAEFLQKYSPKALGYNNQHEMLQALTKAMGSDFHRYSLRAVTWNVAFNADRGYVAVPPIHPLAPAVTADEVRAGAAKVFDLTDSAEASPVAKATSFRAAKERMRRRILPYGDGRELVLVSDETIATTFPKGEKLILLASSESDGTAYNMVNVLHGMGYRDLGIFRGGRAELQGKSVSTPEAVPGISTVDLSMAQALAQDAEHVLVVDTRSVGDYMAASLPGAKPYPYYESRDDSVLRGSAMKMAELVARGEKYELPAGKQALLFYGVNELDWKALKAAVFARDSGVKKVYWYRKGMEDWRFPALLGQSVKLQQNKNRETQDKAWREHNMRYSTLTYDNLQKLGAKAPPRGSGKVVPAEDKGYLLFTPNLVTPQFKKSQED